MRPDYGVNRVQKRTRTQTRVNEEQLHSSVNEEEREESSEDFEDSRARAKRSKALGGTSSAAARNAHQSLIGTINFLYCFVRFVTIF